MGRVAGGLVLLACGMLAACHNQPKSEGQRAKDDGLRPAAAQDQATPARANGPFGIARGETLAALDKPEQLNPGFYKVGSVPQPYPNVEDYIVQNTPQHGTCMVKAIGESTPSDSFGQKAKSAIDAVRDDVSTRYGKPTHAFDFLQSGSIWNDPQDFMMGLAKNERTYSYFWVAPKGADPNVWRGVESVGLVLNGDGQKAWWTLEYDFVGNQDCDKDLKQQAAKAL